MSEPTKETKAPVITAPVLTVEKAEEHIKKIDEFLSSKDEKGKPKFEGVAGFNPFLYRQQVLFKLEEDLIAIKDKIITDTAEINRIIAGILAIPVNIVPDQKALSRDSLIARDRRTMKK